MKFKLIIGCGGSGLATMIAHWQRLAYGRNRNPDSYCYLAIDSGRNALIDFQSAMERLGGGVRPLVQTIQIGRDDNRVEDLVYKHFVAPFKDGGNDVGKARLQKHWWHDENGRPYRGNPGIMGVDYNAVDCYGFTWDGLLAIENAIRYLMDYGLHVCLHGGSPSNIMDVDVYVISSLAGNTGRGSWSLVALKVREFISKRFGKNVRTVGVLYDAMVYESIFRGELYKRQRCMVNAMTGLSELSCWLAKNEREDSFSYRLPNLHDPQNERSDVIVADGDDENTCEGPITELRLVREEPGFQSPLEYFKETADVLYLDMAGGDAPMPRMSCGFTSSAFASASSNYTSSHSVSACSSRCDAFEVEAPKIEWYCKTEAYKVAVRRFLCSDDDVSSDVVQLFKTVPLDNVVRELGDVRPDDRGSLFQRLASVLMKRAESKFAGFMERLPRMKVEEAMGEMEAIVKKVSSADVETAMAEVLLSLGMKDGSLDNVFAFVEEEAIRVLRGSSEQTVSLGRLRDLLLQLQSALTKSGTSVEVVSPSMSAMDAMRKFGKRTFFEILFGRPVFSEGKIAMLLRREGAAFSGIIVDQFLSNNYEELRRTVDGLREGMLKKVAELRSTVQQLEESGQRVCEYWEKHGYDDGFGMTTGVSDGEGAYRRIFAAPDNIFDSIVEDRRANIGSHRILKPIVESREQLSHLIEESLLETGLERVRERLVDRMFMADDKVDDAASLDHEVRDIIEHNITLKQGFMENNFAFMKVLESNRIYWNEEIKRQQGSNDSMGEIGDFFRRMLGVELIRDWDHSCKLPDVDEIKYTIVGTLSHCSAACNDLDWDVGAQSVEMTVWVPFAINEDGWKVREHGYGKYISEAGSFTVHDITNPASSFYAYFSRTNFFIITSGEPVAWKRRRGDAGPVLREESEVRLVHLFDVFRSLRYYMKPDVAEKLMETEREDGKSIFDKDPSLGGLGYPSPIYVRDAKLSALRWKPWVSVQETSHETL